MEEFSELVHKGRKYHLIVRTGREIKNWYPNEVTDDLGIHCYDMPVNGGLENHPTLIVLSHLKVGIEKSDEPGKNNASTCVHISSMVSLDSLIDAILRRHHDVDEDHIPLSDDVAVHDFGLECASLFLCPLADSALGTDCRHDSAHKKQEDFAKYSPKKISLLGHKNCAE
jgi:hypothetical protein